MTRSAMELARLVIRVVADLGMMVSVRPLILGIVELNFYVVELLFRGVRSAVARRLVEARAALGAVRMAVGGSVRARELANLSAVVVRSLFRPDRERLERNGLGRVARVGEVNLQNRNEDGRRVRELLLFDLGDLEE